MHATQQSATEKALADRDRQFAIYRAAKRRQYDELYADPVHGERLRKFRATLQHFGIEDADRMVEYVQRAHWLKTAPMIFSFAALEMIDSRIQRIRVRAGAPVFDDPLPGEDLDVFQLSKKALGL